MSDDGTAAASASGIGAIVAEGGPGHAAVSAGTWATARAGAQVLVAGGNAVDAVLAMTVAAAVAEESVASLGGGGFLTIRTADGQAHVRDFFVDTPGRGLPGHALDLHFLPMDVQYPHTVQTFHVGLGSVAVPGLLAGILEAHAEFASLELADLVEPARRYAEQGVVIEPAQGVMLALVRDLMALTPPGRALVERDGRWLGEGDTLTNPELAAFLDRLGDGAITSLESAPFAGPLLSAMADGGLVTAADLAAYTVLSREPVTVQRRGHVLHTNPPPSFGGPIIADTLGAAPTLDPGDPDSWLAVVQTLAEATDHHRGVAGSPIVTSGTTHASAVDADGMVAVLTQSNGVTSGFVVPGTGIHLNNMLGEADLNPDGFHAAPPGRRMGSMMSPSILVAPDGGVVGLGTGGSERIRSALVEVMLRMIDAGQSLADAVAGARVHLDAGGLQVEPHLPPGARAGLGERSPWPVRVWPSANVFFGGVNAVQRTPDGRVTAVADARRGGGALVVRVPR